MNIKRSSLSLTVALALAVPLAADARLQTADAASCPAMQQNDPIVLHPAAPLYRPSGFARTILNVSLSRNGLVRTVTVGRSSGNAKFDTASLVAVKSTAFAPAARSCVAVAGIFRYAITADKGNAIAMKIEPHSTNADISQAP